MMFPYFFSFKIWQLEWDGGSISLRLEIPKKCYKSILKNKVNISTHQTPPCLNNCFSQSNIRSSQERPPQVNISNIIFNQVNPIEGPKVIKVLCKKIREGNFRNKVKIVISILKNNRNHPQTYWHMHKAELEGSVEPHFRYLRSSFMYLEYSI